MSAVETLQKHGGKAVLALSEVAATGVVVKYSLDGNPLSFHNLTFLYAFTTFYIGIPMGVAIQSVVNTVMHVSPDINKIEQSSLNFPNSPMNFPRTEMNIPKSPTEFPR